MTHHPVLTMPPANQTYNRAVTSVNVCGDLKVSCFWISFYFGNFCQECLANDSTKIVNISEVEADDSVKINVKLKSTLF